MTDNNFAPKDYKVPTSGGLYMKFEEGNNKFMILDKPIMGYEYWNNLNKPVRSIEKFTTTPNIKVEKDGSTKINHFWIMPVYNYKEEDVQILEITQKTIQNAILGYSNNEDWGNPILKYSITVSKSGTGLGTEYSVMANPTKEVAQSIKDAWERNKADVVEEISKMVKPPMDQKDVEYPDGPAPEDIPF